MLKKGFDYQDKVNFKIHDVTDTDNQNRQIKVRIWRNIF